MKPTKRGVAIHLHLHIEKNKFQGNQRGLGGCPFIGLRCYHSCGVIFPSTLYSKEYVVQCPCRRFKKAYVIRRCDLFVNKHLTND